MRCTRVAATTLLPEKTGALARLIGAWPERRLLWAFGIGLGLLYALAHAPYSAKSPDDLDGVNFLLGLREFDVARHQPHPPGYAVYMVLGRLLSGGLAWFMAGSSPGQIDVAALSILSYLSGAVAVVFLIWMCWWLERRPRTAILATLVAATSPLFWFTGGRPLSDLPGLMFGVVGMAGLMANWRWTTSAPQQTTPAAGDPPSPSTLWLASSAVIVGLAVGVRVQMAWLCMPLLLVLALTFVAQRHWAAAATLVSSLVAGILLWVVPMVVASGGLDAYLAALNQQSSFDLTQARTLWSYPTPSFLVQGLLDTFVSPWGDWRTASAVLAAAVLGMLSSARTSRNTLVLALVIGGPYLILHLLFHETAHTRYALPLVPLVAYFAVRGLERIEPRAPAIGAIGIAVVGLASAHGPLRLHAQAMSPALRAATDLRQSAPILASTRPVVMHESIALALRGEGLAPDRVIERAGHEWMSAVRFWLDGNTDPLWFLAHHPRSDLALIDAGSRHLVRSFQWPFETRYLMGGARPGRVDWYEFEPPDWFVGEGWSLTPETAGVAARDGQGPVAAPIRAYIRRRGLPGRLTIGGRNAEGSEARVSIALEGHPLHQFVVGKGATFLETVTIPKDRLDGGPGYAELTVTAVRDVASAPLDVSVRQFDVRSGLAPMVAYGEGWHAAEYGRAEGRSWRWMTREATIQVTSFGRDVRLRVTGEEPLHYFPRPTQVTVSAGAKVVKTFVVGLDFDLTIALTRDVLETSGGVVTLRADQSFVPAEAGTSADGRELALRIWTIEATFGRGGTRGPRDEEDGGS